MQPPVFSWGDDTTSQPHPCTAPALRPTALLPCTQRRLLGPHSSRAKRKNFTYFSLFQSFISKIKRRKIIIVKKNKNIKLKYLPTAKQNLKVTSNHFGVHSIQEFLYLAPSTLACLLFNALTGSFFFWVLVTLKSVWL